MTSVCFDLISWSGLAHAARFLCDQLIFFFFLPRLHLHIFFSSSPKGLHEIPRRRCILWGYPVGCRFLGCLRSHPPLFFLSPLYFLRWGVFVPFPNSETIFENVKMKKPLRGITGVAALTGFDFEFHHFYGFMKMTFPFCSTPQCEWRFLSMWVWFLRRYTVGCRKLLLSMQYGLDTGFYGNRTWREPPVSVTHSIKWGQILSHSEGQSRLPCLEVKPVMMTHAEDHSGPYPSVHIAILE